MVGAHTLVLSAVSRREVAGAGRGLGRAALAATGGVTAAAATLARKRLASERADDWRTGSRRLGRAAATAALLGAYATALGRAELAAARDPSPAART